MRLIIQLITESIRFAITSLRVNKLRTALSLLGISIGIFTIISVFTAVDTLKNNLRNDVQKLGSSVIYVQKWPWSFGPDYPWWKYFNRPVPSYADYTELSGRLQGAEAVTFSVQINGRNVKYGSNTVENVSISGTSHDFDKIKTINITDGRYFSGIESQTGRNVCIIGSEIAVGLFNGASAIGRDIIVMGRKLRVIGLVAKEGEDLFGTSLDNTVILPINFARNLIDTRNERYNPNITIKAKDGVELNELEGELQGTMRSIRSIKPGGDDNFALNKSSLLTKQLEGLFDVLDIVGIIIGGFSILVGGFGIANIMFVSVRERTSEIGIQKSLGAKNFFVLLQFLVEAVVLCLMGGLIGLLVVFGGTFLINSLLETSFYLSIGNIIKGIMISVAIGMISGFIPALSASRLDPVEAMRSK